MRDRRPPSNFCKPRRKQSGYSPARTTSTLTLLQTSRAIRLSPLVLFFLPSRACQKTVCWLCRFDRCSLTRLSQAWGLYFFARFNRTPEQKSCRMDRNVDSELVTFRPEKQFPSSGDRISWQANIQIYFWHIFTGHNHLKLLILITIRSTDGEIFIWCVEEAVRSVNTTK